MESNQRILITGALGQIGRVLIDDLVDRYGADAVLATDLREAPLGLPCDYRSLDATDAAAWASLSAEEGPFTRIYHLVAVLSARGEQDPWRSWDLNMQAWRNALQMAGGWPGCRIFFPSSIAVYGPPLPQTVSEEQVLRPTTVYGISKAAGEQWGAYLFEKYGLDVRCLRLPGVIGHQTMPGGGTTDYAVDIFYSAVKGETFRCFLSEHAALPMIYMDDLLRGIEEFMCADRSQLNKQAVYNLDGFSVTPGVLAKAIQNKMPDFEIVYAPDHRQAIADSWPQELNGSAASRDWNWTPQFDTEATVQAMLEALHAKVLSN